MPTHADLQNVTDVYLDPRVRRHADIDRIERNEHAWLLPERGVVEDDIFTILSCRLVPPAEIQSASYAAEDVFLIFGIGGPSSGGSADRGVAPGVDVDGETVGVDVGCVALDAGARSSHIDHPEEDDVGVIKGRSKLMRGR